MLDMEAIRNFSIDKSDWKKVKFGDVVFEPKESVKDPIAECIEHVVGLEHIDSEDMHLRRSASIEESTTFTKKFSNGDVLFGRRRAYLKKAAKANFEGICSGDITVMRANEELLLPELLPFIVNNEKFFDHAITHSAGGLSPRVKFQDLARFEFQLPPINKQQNLIKLLNVSSDEIEAKINLVAKYSYLISSFRMDVFKRSNWPVRRLNDFFEVQLGKMLSKNAKTGTSPFPYLANQNVQWGRFNLGKVETMDFNEKEREKFKLVKGDLLVCEGGEVGRTSIWMEELENCYYQKALHRLRVINESYLPEVMLQFMIWANDEELFKGLTGSTTIAHLTAVTLKEFKIPSIPMDKQFELKIKFEQLIHTHKNIKNNLAKSIMLQKAIINKVF